MKHITLLHFQWVSQDANNVGPSYDHTIKEFSRAPIQYKDDILPVKEIPLWR